MIIGLIIGLLSLSTVIFYVYKNNLFQETPINQMATDDEKNVALEKIVEKTLAEGEKLESVEQ